MRAALMFLVLLNPVGAALAQHHPSSPYAGLESRQIKSLSEAQIADLMQGRGAGLALAAELNGYPGPVHVLELGAQLDLTGTQRKAVEELVAAMRAETIPLGEALIAQEAALDHQFAARTITAASLLDRTREIALTHGALRAAHLRYHLATMEVLMPSQTATYVQQRGYGSRPAQHQHKAH